MAIRPVYSTRLLAWAASSLVPPYTVPTGYIVVVRDADVTTGGGAMTDFQLSINGIAKFWVGQFTVESIPQAAHYSGRVVMNAGEELLFESDQPTDGVVSGYVLLVP